LLITSTEGSGTHIFYLGRGAVLEQGVVGTSVELSMDALGAHGARTRDAQKIWCALLSAWEHDLVTCARTGLPEPVHNALLPRVSAPVLLAQWTISQLLSLSATTCVHFSCLWVVGSVNYNYCK
jgi:hypothetical protein